MVKDATGFFILLLVTTAVPLRRKRRELRFLVLLLLCVLVSMVTSQVTFSKDWKGGKRNAPTYVDCGPFIKLCKRFIHDLKQVVTSDFRRKWLEPEDLHFSYDDDK